MIGIDPGQTGALAAIGHNGNVEGIMDMPIVQFANSKAKFVDGARLHEFFSAFPPRAVFVELVASRPRQGISSAFQFGSNYGAVVCASLLACKDVYLVTPTVWKTTFGLQRAAKDAGRIRALQVFPDLSKELKRKKDGGRADAVLVAEHARRTLSK